MAYLSSPHHRFYANQRCPFCSKQQVCEWNCLLTNYPEVCLELDPDNPIGPHQVTAGTTLAMTWLCHNHKIHENDPPFKYKTIPERKISGTGCPKCVKGYDQKVGGHAQFVQDSISTHGLIYRYDECYNGSTTPVRIWCGIPLSSKNDTINPHGYFMKTPIDHKRGSGCPICISLERDSKLMQRVKSILFDLGYRLFV